MSPSDRLPALALVLAGLAALAGCSADDPRSCTVACSAEGECPGGTTCGGDGFCHTASEAADSCSNAGGPDGGTDEMDGSAPDGGVDGPDGCSGADSFADEVSGPIAIPDEDLVGISSTIRADAPCAVIRTVEVSVDITHTYRGDLTISLTSPAGEQVVLLAPGPDPTPDVHETFDAPVAVGESASGAWLLTVIDDQLSDIGTLDRWSIGINQAAP